MIKFPYHNFCWFVKIVCVDELKLSLLSKSCLCPGLVALISNLISSSNDPDESKINSEWLVDYWKGKAYEIYQISIDEHFQGKTFSWLAKKIYEKFKAILFALEIKINDKCSKIIPNPGNFKIPNALPRRSIFGYIFAESWEQADNISKFKFVDESEVLNKIRRRSVGRFANFPWLKNKGGHTCETNRTKDDSENNIQKKENTNHLDSE